MKVLAIPIRYAEPNLQQCISICFGRYSQNSTMPSSLEKSNCARPPCGIRICKLRNHQASFTQLLSPESQGRKPQQKQIIKKKRKKEKTREPEAASLPVTSQLSHDILHLGRRIACACWLRNNRRLTAVRAAVLHLWMSSMVLLMWWRRKWCRCTAAERP